MTIFKFTICYDNDFENLQFRYVCAESEAEAIEKLCKHNDNMVKNGYMKFTFDDSPIVEIENIII